MAPIQVLLFLGWKMGKCPDFFRAPSVGRQLRAAGSNDELILTLSLISLIIASFTSDCGDGIELLFFYSRMWNAIRYTINQKKHMLQ